MPKESQNQENPQSEIQSKRDQIKSNYEIINKLSNEDLKNPAILSLLKIAEESTFELQREVVQMERGSKIELESSYGDTFNQSIQEARTLADPKQTEMVPAQNPPSGELIVNTENTFTGHDLEDVKINGIEVYTLFKTKNFDIATLS